MTQNKEEELHLQRKALYNLLRLNLNNEHKVSPSIEPAYPWQVDNYRKLSNDVLTDRLAALTIPFDETQAAQFDTPEELTDALTTELSPLDQDQAYLLLFELWRRLFPEKRTLSIFCDELDYQMTRYDEDLPHKIQDQLAYLQQLLDEYQDEGNDPQEIFDTIQTYCAIDLESFLYDFTLDNIETQHIAYAIELLEGFTPYINDTTWFTYLKIRTEIDLEPEEGYEHLEKLIAKVNTYELGIEILDFLATSNYSLFHKLAIKTLPLLEKEEDFLEYANICLEHYHYFNLEKPAEAIANLMKKWDEHSALDQVLKSLKGILNQKTQLALED